MIDPAILRDNLEGAVRTPEAWRGSVERARRARHARIATAPDTAGARGLKREQNAARRSGASERQGRTRRQFKRPIVSERSRSSSSRRARRRRAAAQPGLADDSQSASRERACRQEQRRQRGVRRHGTPREFAFNPQAHWDLGPALGIIDFERGRRLRAPGSRC